MASRPTASPEQQQRVAEVLAKYTTNPELELQQRAVEFASLFTLGELKVGVLERMPLPEPKATVMGIGTSYSVERQTAAHPCLVSENKPVGSTRATKDVRSYSWNYFRVID